jgi:hypothetical protein
MGSIKPSQELDAVVVGAGFGGISMTHRSDIPMLRSLQLTAMQASREWFQRSVLRERTVNRRNMVLELLPWSTS